MKRSKRVTTLLYYYFITTSFKTLTHNNFASIRLKTLARSERTSMALLKIVRIRNFSGPYFPAFGLNTEILNTSSYTVWINEWLEKILRMPSITVSWDSCLNHLMKGRLFRNKHCIKNEASSAIKQYDES